jgi:cytochrome c556
MNRIVIVLAAVTVLVTGGALAQPRLPQDQSPEDAVAERQNHMSTLGDNIRIVARFVRSGEGDMETVAEAARTMDEAAADLPALFPEGTGVGVSDSEALPVIWENWSAFTEVAQSAEQEITALAEAAEGGDPDAIRAQFARVGRSCSACHDTYRE